mgnify:FL=1
MTDNTRQPLGYRGSYIQHREAGIAPQVVFEVLSLGNRRAEMNDSCIARMDGASRPSWSWSNGRRGRGSKAGKRVCNKPRIGLV